MSSGAEGAKPLTIVTVNGEVTELPATVSLAELIQSMAVAGRYAVEVNGEIVPRSEHGRRLLTTDDRIEVVHAIGGG